MRVNKIYTQEVFGDCQDGFGFQIKKVSVCWNVLFELIRVFFSIGSADVNVGAWSVVENLRVISVWCFFHTVQNSHSLNAEYEALHSLEGY